MSVEKFKNLAETVKENVAKAFKKLKEPKIALITAGSLLVVITIIVAIVINLPHDNTETQLNSQPVSYKDTHTVTFKTNGGSVVATQYIESGLAAKRPRIPTKDGFEFVGWYVDQDLTEVFDFDTILKSDLTLYAKWRASGEGNKEEAKEESKDNSNDTQKENKTNENKSESNRENTPPQDNQTAKTDNSGNKPNSNPSPSPTPTPAPEPTYYTVSFNSNGGSVVGSVRVESGKTIAVPASPTKPHYNFAGWTLNGANYNFGSPVSSDLTLTAVWTQKSFHIVQNKIDDYSPDVMLSVTEDGVSVLFSGIYFGGAEIASAANPYASRNELANGTYTVILSDGVTVTAGL